MNSYFLCVTQPSNVGDLLINRMLVEELSRYGKVYVDCYNIPDTFKRILISDSNNIIDVSNVFKFSLKKGSFLKFSRFVKTHNIQLYTQSPGPLNRISKLPSRICFKIIRKILISLNVPFIRIGNCCSSAIINNTNVIESQSVIYYVRSLQGVSFLQQFRKTDIHYIPDLAFLYKRHVRTNYTKKKIAVMSFRQVCKNLDAFELWVTKSVSLLQANDYNVIFYYQVEKDKNFMRYLYNRLGNKNIELKQKILWYDNFSFYEDKSIVISNRLHCLLLGAVYNAVPLACMYEENELRKITDVLESSIGNESKKYITDIYSDDRLIDIIDNVYVYRKKVSDIVDTNFKICQETVKNIINKLDLKEN